MLFDIGVIINKLKEKRKIFVSEADFQLEMAWVIKEVYPQAKVRLEYCPSFDDKMHLDILIIMDGRWIPIELKYKTKGCTKLIDEESYCLKNHGAKDINCYLYLKDIQRIEKIKRCITNFQEGYAIFLTNDLSYLKKPSKQDCIYREFSLEDNITKAGELDWLEGTSEGTKKNCENPIILQNSYTIKWGQYSMLDNTNTGNFKILINKVV